MLSQAFTSPIPALVARTLDAALFIASEALQSIITFLPYPEKDDETKEVEGTLISAADAETLTQVREFI